MMRVTNAMIANNFRKSVQRATEALVKYQERVSSGLFVRRPSDDPARANRILSIRTAISKNEQYIFNADNAGALLDATSSVYGEVTEILNRAHELAHNALTASTNPEDLTFFATETEQLIESVMGSGNSEFADSYLFAGNRTDRKPFSANRARGVTVTLSGPVLEDSDYVIISMEDWNNSGLSAIMPELIGEEVSLENPDGQNVEGKIIKINANREENVVRVYLSELDPEFNLSEDAVISTRDLSVNILSSYVNRDRIEEYILMNIDDVRRMRLSADDGILIKDNDREIHAVVDKIGEPDGATGEVKVYLEGIDKDTVISPNASVFKSHTQKEGKILSVEYRGDSGLHSERVSKDVYITTNTPGDVVYERIFDQLIRLRDAFESGSSEEINLLFEGLEDSITHIANLQTEVGVKLKRVDTIRSRLKDENTSLSAFLEKIEQVNITDAITDFRMQENVLNATLASGARVLTPTLFNFM